MFYILCTAKSTTTTTNEAKHTRNESFHQEVFIRLAMSCWCLLSHRSFSFSSFSFIAAFLIPRGEWKEIQSVECVEEENAATAVEPGKKNRETSHAMMQNKEPSMLYDPDKFYFHSLIMRGWRRFYFAGNSSNACERRWYRSDSDPIA